MLAVEIGSLATDKGNHQRQVGRVQHVHINTGFPKARLKAFNSIKSKIYVLIARFVGPVEFLIKLNNNVKRKMNV